MGLPASGHRHELHRCILHRSLHGRVSGEHFPNPPGSEFLSVRRRGAATIFSGRRDSAVLLASAVLDVSTKTVPEDLGPTSDKCSCTNSSNEYSYSLRFAGLRVHACSRASSIRYSEWNPGGKIGHNQISGEAIATYFSVASLAGAIVTFSVSALPFAACLDLFGIEIEKDIVLM